MSDVFITKTAAFLPNSVVTNDEIEDYLGLINGRKSKSKNIVLRSNRIKERYYAIDKNGYCGGDNKSLGALIVNKDSACNQTIELK